MAKQIMPGKAVPFPIDEWPSVVIQGLTTMIDPVCGEGKLIVLGTIKHPYWKYLRPDNGDLPDGWEKAAESFAVARAADWCWKARLAPPVLVAGRLRIGISAASRSSTTKFATPTGRGREGL